MFQLAQTTLDILAWFLYPFAVCLVITWVVNMFRYK